jgi:ketosteroid isomerase-like protein
MSTHDIAHDLITLCKAGQFAKSGEKYWADDVVSIEPRGQAGMDPVSRGKAATRAKTEWWTNAHETHSVLAEGPYVNGDQFTVRFKMDVTDKGSGQRMHLDEIALYTLKNGKIAEERFFYGG